VLKRKKEPWKKGKIGKRNNSGTKTAANVCKNEMKLNP